MKAIKYISGFIIAAYGFGLTFLVKHIVNNDPTVRAGDPAFFYTMWLFLVAFVPVVIQIILTNIYIKRRYEKEGNKEDSVLASSE